jgi:hypothetical protein
MQILKVIIILIYVCSTRQWHCLLRWV